MTEDRAGKLSRTDEVTNVSRSKGNKGELKKKKSYKDATLNIYDDYSSWEVEN